MNPELFNKLTYTIKCESPVLNSKDNRWKEVYEFHKDGKLFVRFYRGDFKKPKSIMTIELSNEGFMKLSKQIAEGLDTFDKLDLYEDDCSQTLDIELALPDTIFLEMPQKIGSITVDRGFHNGQSSIGEIMNLFIAMAVPNII